MVNQRHHAAITPNLIDDGFLIPKIVVSLVSTHCVRLNLDR